MRNANSSQNSQSNRRKGYTMLELLAVIAMLVALSSIILPLYSRYVTRAEASAFHATARSFDTGLLAYFQDQQSFEGLMVAADGEIRSSTASTQLYFPILDCPPGWIFICGDVEAGFAFDREGDGVNEYYRAIEFDATRVNYNIVYDGQWTVDLGLVRR